MTDSAEDAALQDARRYCVDGAQLSKLQHAHICQHFIAMADRLESLLAQLAAAEQRQRELAAERDWWSEQSKQVRADTIEECAQVCEDYGAEQWARYKRGDRTDPSSGRADPHTQGLSCGADVCADAIRALAGKQD